MSKITLSGQDAIDLWLQGKDAWNQWVKENPVADVSFHGVDFGQFDLPEISFAGFHFTDGVIFFRKVNFGEVDINFSYSQFGMDDVDFSYAKFGKGNVDFSHSQFGIGDIDFSYAKFGEGYIDFSYSQFGEGDVSFYNVDFNNGDMSFYNSYFGEGEVSFASAIFRKGHVNFSDIDFGEGDIFFSGASFGKGDIAFSHSYFSQGEILFYDVTFGEGTISFASSSFRKTYISFLGSRMSEGNIDFSYSQFIEGNIEFNGISFQKGNIYFSNIHFSNYDILFSDAIFNKGKIDFRRTKFESVNLNFSNVVIPDCSFLFEHVTFSQDNRLNFDNLKIDGAFNFIIGQECLDYLLTEFSLRNATINGPGLIEGTFDTIPDLRGSKTSHHMDLSGIIIHPPKYQKDTRKTEAAKLRRLKEIAENNKHHEAALRFHGDEMRTLRWSEPKRMGKYIVDWLFDLTSNYGQSLKRPLLGLLLICFLLFTSLYHFTSTSAAQTGFDRFCDAGLLSLTSIFGFLPITRDIRNKTIETLFTANHESWIDLALITQGGLSFIFLFLLGLGLRNRFRL